jgi:primosomal protein N' (replication factor Y) (superfamily II helicase)
VHDNFPKARTLRWDRDVTHGQESHERILETFTNRQADILIGTQMVAKGLDLPRVTLVGVVNADLALNLPDFRASERTFQLLTQVGGRAGRGSLGGRVIIQTYYPEHYAITAAARHDYIAFYEQELRFRREAAYPPFRPLVRLLIVAARESDARETSARLAKALIDRIRCRGVLDVDVVGPAPAFFTRWAGKYRYHVLVRGSNARELLARLPPPPGCRVDVDPMNLL